MSFRAQEQGYVKIGATCSAGRRSLWMRLNVTSEERARIDERVKEWGEEDGGFAYAKAENIESFELCAGREGDDDYLKIDHSNPQFAEILAILLSAQYAAET